MARFRGKRRSELIAMRPNQYDTRSEAQNIAEDDEDKLLNPDDADAVDAGNDVADATAVEGVLATENDDADLSSPVRGRANSVASEVTDGAVGKDNPDTNGGGDGASKDNVTAGSVGSVSQRAVAGPGSDDANGSYDSGHAENMDTSDVADDGLEGHFASVSLIEEAVKVNFPITARPPCLVDAETVSCYLMFGFEIGNVVYFGSSGSGPNSTDPEDFGHQHHCWKIVVACGTSHKKPEVLHR